MEAANPAISADPTGLVTVIAALAATFVAVGLYLLFKLTDCLTHFYVARTKRRVALSRRFLTLPHLGRLVCAIDIVCVIGVRSIVALYLAFLLLFITPIFLTIESLNLAAALIRAPGG